MHPALRLTEVLEVICSFVPRRALARLARTCRTFEDPSLDALWYELDPADRVFTSLCTNIMFSHLPTRDQWDQMRRYTSRITIVGIESPYVSLEPRTSRLPHPTLFPGPPPEGLPPMFPKLKEVRINYLAAHDHNLPLFRYVSGPSVTRLQLTIDPSRWGMVPMTEFITSLTTLYPNIRRVEVMLNKHTSNKVPEGMLQMLSQAICSWKHLVHGSFNVFDALVYEHLSRLHTLTSLHLDISCHDNSARLQEALLPPAPFPAVTDIQLVAHSVDDCVKWIDRHKHFPLASNLICGLRHSESSLKPDELCRSIATHFHRRSLQSIRLYHTFRFYQTNISQFDAVRPLLSFNRLRSVTLSKIYALSMDDTQLEELASSWPLLEELDIKHRISETIGPTVDTPTFRGLFKLVQHCPRLQVLTIVINMKDTAWVDLDNPCDGASARLISRVDFGSSPIEDAKRVASILKAIFPFLEWAGSGTWNPDVPYSAENRRLSRLWSDVNTHLGNLSQTEGI